jgi:protein TonB
MSSEERVKAEPCAGTLSGCLVDGNAEVNAREKKVKRGALAISVALQTAGLAVLVMAPLFAKQPEPVGRNAMPIPPYTHHAAQRVVSRSVERARVIQTAIHFPTAIPPTIQTHDDRQQTSQILDEGINLDSTGNDDAVGQLNALDSRVQPARPDEPPRTKQRIHETHVDSALLTRRIEPLYPPLARQTRRSGKVELHAIIGTDGGVQSLEVVSGDQLFISSALEAVRQWRYKPTYLNGQPVEIDTYISVIYTLNQ